MRVVLPGVGVADDGEGPAAGRLLGGCGHGQRRAERRRGASAPTTCLPLADGPEARVAVAVAAVAVAVVAALGQAVEHEADHRGADLAGAAGACGASPCARSVRLSATTTVASTRRDTTRASVTGSTGGQSRITTSTFSASARIDRRGLLGSTAAPRGSAAASPAGTHEDVGRRSGCTASSRSISPSSTSVRPGRRGPRRSAPGGVGRRRSQHTTATRSPPWAMAMARLATVVVLPSPAVGDVTWMTWIGLVDARRTSSAVRSDPERLGRRTVRVVAGGHEGRAPASAPRAPAPGWAGHRRCARGRRRCGCARRACPRGRRGRRRARAPSTSATAPSRSGFGDTAPSAFGRLHHLGAPGGRDVRDQVELLELALEEGPLALERGERGRQRLGDGVALGGERGVGRVGRQPALDVGERGADLGDPGVQVVDLRLDLAADRQQLVHLLALAHLDERLRRRG